MSQQKNRRKKVCLLGATGSIGTSSLEVLALHPEDYEVYAVSGFSQTKKLLKICQKFNPTYVALPEEQAANFSQQLKQVGCSSQVIAGKEALVKLASLEEINIVISALVGFAGLESSLAAAKAGKRILLANKEALVVAGELFMQAVEESGAELLPVDSEHNAIFQCLPANFSQRSLASQGIEKLILTASGGPFLGWSKAELAGVTPKQAVAHPNWSMGQKISVDSATLMNKGLELIEACWLFNTTPASIEVLIHPQSVIHSMVSYKDGSFLAHLGEPDMRTPIAHALAWPKRIESGVKPFNFLTAKDLTFQAPDEQAFPCLNLARQAFNAGDNRPAILNAANEVAVAAFLQKRLAFNQIPRIIEQTLNLLPQQKVNAFSALVSYHEQACQTATNLINRLK